MPTDSAIRYWDMNIDESIIDNHMLDEVWRELTAEQKSRAAKASAQVEIPEHVCQRRAYLFYEPSHELIGVFNPNLLDASLALNALIAKRDSPWISIYTLENSKVIDFYGIRL